jgi:hypothetical protein
MLTSRVAAVPCHDHGGGRLLGRCAVALVGALAVFAGATAAAPSGPLTAPADAAVKASAAARTVQVDPLQCSAKQTDPSVVVVCRPDQVARVLIDRGTVVLSGARHRGTLDLRNRNGVTVRGEAGAVLDAAGARYALSVRDASDVVVEQLTLQGGSAQTVWLERTRRVTLRSVTVAGSRGAGVQLRDSAGFVLSESRVQDAASAGVMELKGVTDSTYQRLVVTRNGRGPALYNGDGLQLSGTRVQVRDVVAHDNGSSALYEHGIYVSAAARSVLLTGVTSYGNSGVAVKIGGSGTLESSTLTDDRIALYCGTTAGPGWTVRTTTLSAPRPWQAEKGCRLQL